MSTDKTGRAGSDQEGTRTEAAGHEGTGRTAGAETLTLPPPGTAIIEVTDIGKSYGQVIALSDVTTSVRTGEVTCVLGDNGAGKSSCIKILAGVHEHSQGTFMVDGVSRQMSSPRAALALGIATVYQDLAVVPLMPVWRNFFLGSETTKGLGPLKRLDVDFMRRTTKSALSDMGIDPVSYTHLRAHETDSYLVCRLL